MCMDQVTDLPIIITIHDDICIYGHTPEEHDCHVLKLMQTAAQHCIVFNSYKFQIRQPQIPFYRAVFTAKCMQPNPAKIQALQDLPTPKSPVKLQSFLGLKNYLLPFIPALANKTMFLQKQTVGWDQNTLTEAAFQCLKPGSVRLSLTPL